MLALANASQTPDLPDPGTELGLANDLQIDDQGWAVIPYGDSRHSGRDAHKANAASPGATRPNGVLQRFSRENAPDIVDDFKSTWSRIKRAVVGLPIFKGHPDAPAFAHIFPDKTPRGTIADMEAGDQGLRLKFVLTNAGAADVEGGMNQFSPFWELQAISKAADGAIIAAPRRLFSVGLVQRGNIPGLSLINAAQAAQLETEQQMKNTLLKLLAALGKPQAADAGDDVVLAAANAAEAEIVALAKAKTDLAAANASKAELETAKATLEGEKVTLANAKTTLEGEKLTLANSKTELEGKLTAAQEAVKAERRERAILLVNSALTAGKILATEKEATITSLCNAADFTAAATTLANKARVLQTQSRATSVAATTTADAPRGEKFLSLVNARMDSAKEDYSAAYEHVAASPEGKALLSAMSHPGKSS